MGNAVAQMVATSDLGSFEEGRRLVRASIEPVHWTPKQPDAWREAFPRWQAARAAAR